MEKLIRKDQIENFHPLRIYNASFVLGCAIFVYLVLRIIYVPVSDDEFMSIDMHVSQDIFSIITTGQPNLDWAANNHVLNTLLMKLELLIFGWKDWAIRLHILLSFLVAFYFSYQIISEITQSEFRKFLYLTILFVNPYYLDFFGLARGYAISFAGVTAALYYLQQYIDHEHETTLKLMFFSLFIAVWSNFLSLYILAGILVLLFYHHLFIHRTEKSKNVLICSIVYTLLIIVVVVFPLIKTLASPISYGGRNGIFQDMIVHYIRQFIHFNPMVDRHAIFVEGWLNIEIYGIIVLLLWIAFTAFSFVFEVKKEISKMQIISLFLVIFVAIISKVLFVLKGTPIPMGRTQLIFGIPFFLGICIAFERIILKRKNFASLLIVVACGMVLHFAKSFNFVNTIEWWQNGDAKVVSSFLKSYNTSDNNSKIKRLGAENWQFHSLAFYIKSQIGDRYEIIWTDLSGELTFDYILVPHSRKSEVPKDYHIIKEFEKTTLFERDGSAKKVNL